MQKPERIMGGVKLFTAASFCCLFCLLLLFSPEAALSGARSGLSLCAEVVIPSLFPFLCLTNFVIRSGLADRSGRVMEGVMRRIFRLPGSAAAAFLLGIIGGYPAGAVAVAGLCKNGSISKSEGNRLLCFCINSGPAFIIGAVGAGLFKSTAVGLILYAAHIAASLAIGFLQRFRGKKEQGGGTGRGSPTGNFTGTRGRRTPGTRNPASAKAFVGSVTDAASSMIAITAFVVLFAAVISLFSSCGILPAAAALLARAIPSPSGDAAFYTRLLTGFFEVSNGCAAAAGAGGWTALLLTSGILGWSGLSVHCQVMASVAGAGLSTRYFILTRALHIAFSLLFTWLLFRLLPAAVPAFASGGTALTASAHSAPASAALLVVAGMLLLSQLKV